MPGEVLQYAGAGRHRERAGAGRHRGQAGGRRGLGLSSRHSVVKKPALPLNFRLLPTVSNSKASFLQTQMVSLLTLFGLENSCCRFFSKKENKHKSLKCCTALAEPCSLCLLTESPIFFPCGFARQRTHSQSHRYPVWLLNPPLLHIFRHSRRLSDASTYHQHRNCAH